MKSIYSLLLCLCCTLHCVAQKNILLKSEYTLLQEAYKKRSLNLLDSFFIRWQHNIVPISQSEENELSDTQKQAYHVFEAFYKPFDIKKIGGSEFGENIYDKVKYLVVQNKVDVYSTNNKIYLTVADSDAIAVENINKSSMSSSRKDSLLTRINGKLNHRVLQEFGPKKHSLFNDNDSLELITKLDNFRPRVKVDGKQVVYLTGQYDNLLNIFLGNTHLPLGTGGIMNTARSQGESRKREDFLNKLIKIWYGHWGGYWQLFSYPMASKITFDKTMKYARVDFVFIYEGGEAILKKEGEEWQLISSKRTWIE